ncbi:MAG: hypothetical protein HUJ98_10765 [Bacteroidaceae bacterium]|nr:hypothetical protein [Bacteroidaceae bacterium]
MSKKKKRKKRKIGIGLVIIFRLFIIALVVAALGAFCYYFCGLEEVTVEGTELYSDIEIQSHILDDEYSFNTVYVVAKNLIFPKTDMPFIDHFKVKMTGLNSINIVCVEKPILGYLDNQDGNFVYFNYDGNIVEVNPRFVEGHIRLEGALCEEPEVGALLDIGERKVGYLVTLIKTVEKYELMPQNITFDENGRMTLVYEDYNIMVGDVDYIEEKMKRAINILPNVEGMKGTLHLENFSPTSTDIVFEKLEEITE